AGRGRSGRYRHRRSRCKQEYYWPRSADLAQQSLQTHLSGYCRSVYLAWRRCSLMKVLVLGAGVIGVTTAYYLSKRGFEVTVIDRQPGPALETSFANAGEVSPGYASPWAGPGVPLKAVRWMLDKYGPLVVRPSANPAMWRWMLQMLRNCPAARYRGNKARMVGIVGYSRDCLRTLRAGTGL